MDMPAPLAQRYPYATPLPDPGSAVLDALLAHRSVRGYRPDPVPAEDIARAVAAAQSAATSSNLQLWSAVTVTDPARKARLNAAAGRQRHIDEAPLLMVWLADLSRLRRLAQGSGRPSAGLDHFEMFLTAAIDAALAAQNAVAAFEAMGYGTCYIGAMRNNPDVVARELALPAEVFAVFGLTVGRPAPGAEGTIKPRLPQATVCHAEQYRAEEPEEIARYDAAMEAFNAGQGLAASDWTTRSTARVAGPEALSGRDRLVGHLRALGFALD